ncbi:MAG: DNA polymerase III subunit beta [Deltaproteobacteria bacterium]|nr:DNA polymerase III subunit beta [Deltaproteobacteria bacterium]
MEFKINKNEFLRGLYLAQGIADRRSTNPAVANVRLRSEGKEAIVCDATDLRISMVAEVSAKVVKEGGLCLGAKHLYEIVKGLPGDEVALKKMDNNWAEIRAGKARYKLVGMSGQDFPRIPDHREVTFKEIDAATLAEMIGKTIISVSSDETRPHLSGIYLESDGKVIRMVSTDGHRLSKVEREVGSSPSLERGVIIPRKGVLEIRRLLEAAHGTCDVGFAQNNVFVRSADVVLSVALVDAQFPPYQQVIPPESEKQVVLDRAGFLESLKRVSIMSSERSWGIRMDLAKGRLRITSDNPDLGEAQEDLEVNYDGTELVIGFNARYFIDALGEMTADRVVLELNGELDPGLVRPEAGRDHVGVIMPMRI